MSNDKFMNASNSGNLNRVKQEWTILKKDLMNDALNPACANGNINVVKFLISEGADDFNEGIRATCNYSGNIDLIELFIDKGAKNFNEGLWYACYGNNFKAAKYMIDKGADINYKDDQGNTPIMASVMNDYPDIKIIKLLVSHGAILNSDIVKTVVSDNDEIKDFLRDAYSIQTVSLQKPYLDTRILNSLRKHLRPNYGRIKSRRSRRFRRKS